MVLVVEGSKEEDEVVEFELPLKEQVELYIEEGMTSKEAIKKVAKERNLPKNEVYTAYHIE